MATSVEPERALRRVRSGTSDAPPVDSGPARWGLRGKVNGLLGGASLLSAGAAELEARDDVNAIRCALPARQSIVVANTEGGMGKTPTVVMLANLFGRHRGGDVVAWDIAGVRGNLGQRSATNVADGNTVWGLLADTNEEPSAEAELARYLCRQPTGDEILASDRAARHMESITSPELVAIGNTLAQHRQIIIFDTGNDDRATAWKWATSSADQLVVPMPYRRGAASSVTSMLATLSARGLDDLVERAIVIASPPPRGAPAAVVEEVRRRLTEFGVRTIVDVPYEPALASYERIDHASLPDATVRAWTHAAAVIAKSLAVGARRPDAASPDSAASTDSAAFTDSAVPTDAVPTDDAQSFDVTTAALRQWSTREPAPAPIGARAETGRRIPARGVMACAAVALAAASAGGVFHLADRADATPPAPVAAQSDSGVDPARASGPAVIRAYDDRYYTDRSAEGAASLWTLPDVSPAEAAARTDQLQKTIDDTDPGMQHRLAVTPTSDPNVFDVVLTLTTSDGVEHPYNQQFTVAENGGAYSIVSKIDCEQQCPAP
jgi:MinD-like ATPase involved in chromosome partitioning or flagellar assembly